MTNVSKSFTHKIAAKTSWHSYGTKLRHCQCHTIYYAVVHSMDGTEGIMFSGCPSVCAYVCSSVRPYPSQCIY